MDITTSYNPAPFRKGKAQPNFPWTSTLASALPWNPPEVLAQRLFPWEGS